MLRQRKDGASAKTIGSVVGVSEKEATASCVRLIKRGLATTGALQAAQDTPPGTGSIGTFLALPKQPELPVS